MFLCLTKEKIHKNVFGGVKKMKMEKCPIFPVQYGVGAITTGSFGVREGRGFQQSFISIITEPLLCPYSWIHISRTDPTI
jgi:hypothetical protein